MKIVIKFALLAVLTIFTSCNRTQTNSDTTDTNDTIVIKNGMGPVHFLRFSPDGQELVRICQFGPVEMFDIKKHSKIRSFSIGMRMVAYNQDGSLIATAEGTDGARIWDSATPGKLVTDHGKDFISKLYILETPLAVLQEPVSDPMQRIFWADFSPDAQRLITTHATGHVKVWNTQSWKLENELILTNVEVRVAMFSPDSKTLIIGDADGVLYEWNFERNLVTKKINTDGAIIGITFSPNGKMLVTTHISEKGRFVTIWDISQWTMSIKNEFSSAAFSKDGRLLILGGNQIEILELETKQVRTIKLQELKMSEIDGQFEKDQNANRRVPISIVALSISPDDGTIAAGLVDGTIRLLNARNEGRP